MAKARRDAAQRLLEQQAREVFNAPQIAGPQPANYGVFGPAFAAATTTAAADPYFGGANRIGLQLHSLGEDVAYERELAATREAQLQAQRDAAYYGFMDKTTRDAADAPIGTYSVGTDQQGRPTIITDPVFAAAENAVDLDERTAESFSKRAAGYGVLADKGFAPTPQDLSMGMRNPLENPESAIQYGVYQTPAARTAAYAADEGMTVEEQFALEEAKGRWAAANRADPNTVEWKQEINPHTGVVEWVAKGTNQAFDTYGLSPPGTAPRPNADARASGASATSGGNLAPVEDARAIATQLFPMIEITQQRRDPNSRLGRANPDSWHNRSNAAIDSRRIPGVSFDQYVQRYRDAGYEIIEARDEYVNPSKHASGPHWHVVLGQRRSPPARTPQARSEAPVRLDRVTSIARRAVERGGKAEVVGDTLVVTAPDGRTRTYDAQGNVVGG